MDQVVFFTHPNRAAGPGASLRRWGIRVNGEDLRLIAAEATRDLWLAQLSQRDDDEYVTRHVLRQYMDMWAREMGAPSRLLWGEPDEQYRQTYGLWVGRLPLLGCGVCGDWTCWPLLAVIESDDRVVIWSAFAQPHRSQWGELEIGPYVFDRAAYEVALAKPEVLDEDPAWAWLPADDDLQG